METAPNIPLMLGRLDADWSADSFNPRPDVLAGITPDAFAGREPLAKCRLLLSCLLAACKQAAFAGGGAAAGESALISHMRRLGAMALADDDAWVKVLGAAAGDFDGRLDMDALCAANPKVRRITIVNYLS